MEIEFCSSVLLVKDINTSRQFYEKFLGQKVEVDHDNYVKFFGGFSVWQMNCAYGTMFRDLPGHNILGHGGNRFELYFETKSLNELYVKLSNSGMEMVHGICEQPWGQRVLRVYDPDGHIVELGEPMSLVIKRFFASGITAGEVSERTHTPLPIVLKEIGMMPE